MRIWHSQTGQEEHFGRGPTFVVPINGTHPVFSPAGRWLVTGGSFGPFTLLDLDQKPLVPKVLVGSSGITRAAFSADAKKIATVGFDRIVRIWDAQTARQLEMPKVQELSQRTAGLPLNCLAYRPDGSGVILGWGGQALQNENLARNSAVVYDVRSGEPIGQPLGHDDPVNAAAFSPDGSMIATVSGQPTSSLQPDNSAKLWQRDPLTNSWGQPKVLIGHKEMVIGAVFSADSRFLVTASRDNTAWVWKATDGKSLAVLDAHRGDVSDVAFSSDGRFILSTSLQDGTARIWDVTTYQGTDGKQIAKVARSRELSIFQGGYTGPGAGFIPGITSFLQAMGDVTSAAFGLDSRTVITASGDGTARLYVCDLCGRLDDLATLAKHRPIWHDSGQENGTGTDWSQYFEEYREIQQMEKQMQQERTDRP